MRVSYQELWYRIHGKYIRSKGETPLRGKAARLVLRGDAPRLGVPPMLCTKLLPRLIAPVTRRCLPRIVLTPISALCPISIKLCREGVDLFDSIRDQIRPADEPMVYSSLIMQQMAYIITAATLDDVKSLLVYPADDVWRWTVIGSLDDRRTFILGSASDDTLTTRDE